MVQQKGDGKIIRKGGGKGGFPGRVVFYSGCVKDESWG